METAFSALWKSIVAGKFLFGGFFTSMGAAFTSLGTAAYILILGGGVCLAIGAGGLYYFIIRPMRKHAKARQEHRTRRERAHS